MGHGAAEFVIGRSHGAVVVTFGGGLDAEAMVLLQDLLVDLIDGQGNVAVDVDLTQAVAGSRTIATFAAALRERFCGPKLTVREPAPARRSQETAVRG